MENLGREKQTGHMFKNREKIVITGSGKSLDDFVQPDDSWFVICVNNSINHPNVKRCDLWFTLDLSQENIDIILNQHEHVDKVVAYSGGDNRLDDEMLESIFKVAYRLDRVADPSTGKMMYHREFQEDPTKISTGNSLYGALNLAYHLNPKVILLCGLDANQECKFDGSKPRNLSHLPELFKSTKRQLNYKGIKVYNSCLYSAVDCFEKLPFDQVIAKYK